jgi:hypothetical protein
MARSVFPKVERKCLLFICNDFICPSVNMIEQIPHPRYFFLTPSSWMYLTGSQEICAIVINCLNYSKCSLLIFHSNFYRAGFMNSDPCLQKFQ